MAKNKWLKKASENGAAKEEELIQPQEESEQETPAPSPEMAKKHNAENIHNNVNTRNYGFQR